MNKRIVSFMFGAALLIILLATAGSAQVQRTFVSGSGSDSNPCSRTAPCRTFAQAISQTNAGGEVVALDSAGYGPFAITKSISVIASPGVYAGISVFSGDGIDINAGGGDTVILRGLTVNNQGNMGSGVVFNSGFKLHVEGCAINGFSNGVGLHLAAGGLAELIDSILRGNAFGILVQPSSGTIMALTIDHVRLEGNGFGLDAREGSQVTVTSSVAANNDNGGLSAFSSSFGSVQMNVENSVVSRNGIVGIEAAAQGTGAVQVNVTRCVISSNPGDGISVSSVSTGVATVRLSSSMVTGNGIGLHNHGSPALLLSRGDNTVEGNTSDSSGTIGSYSAK